MRWTALGVDYEMAGKDLIDSVTLSSKICKALGGDAARRLQLRAVPRRQRREDLEVEGQRADDRGMAGYATPESLSLFMFQKPKSAKKLYFDVIPARGRRLPAVPVGLSGPGRQAAARQSDLAHSRRRAAGPELPITFGLLLNLASVSNAESKEVMWGFLRRYSPGATPRNQSDPRSAFRVRDPLFRRFRETDEVVPPSRRCRDGAH